MWAIIKPDEDGNPISLVHSRDQLEEILEDPKGWGGIERFMDVDFLINQPDANYWPDRTAVLIEFHVVVPRTVTSKWTIDS